MQIHVTVVWPNGRMRVALKSEAAREGWNTAASALEAAGVAYIDGLDLRVQGRACTQTQILRDGYTVAVGPRPELQAAQL